MHPLLLSLVFLTSTLSWTVVEVSSVPRKDSSSSALIEQSHLQRRAENSNNNNNKKKNNKNNNDPQDAHARQVQALNQHMVTQAGKYRGEICAWCMKSCVENTKKPRSSLDCEIDCTVMLNSVMEAEGYAPIIDALLHDRLLPSYHCTVDDLYSGVDTTPLTNPEGYLVVPRSYDQHQGYRQRGDTGKWRIVEPAGADTERRRMVRKKKGGTEGGSNWANGQGQGGGGGEGGQVREFTGWFQQQSEKLVHQGLALKEGVGNNMAETLKRFERGELRMKIPKMGLSPLSSPGMKVGVPGGGGGGGLPVPAALKMIPGRG